MNGNEVAEYRAILEKQTGFESVEVIVSRGRREMLKSVQSPDEALDDPSTDFGKCVWSDTAEWPTLVRAGLAAASGDHLVILDVNRHYSPDSLIRVLDPVRGNQCDLAVAIPRRGRFRLASQLRSWLGLRFISRLFLGTSDVFSGLLRSVARHGIRNLGIGPPRINPGSGHFVATACAVDGRAGGRR